MYDYIVIMTCHQLVMTIILNLSIRNGAASSVPPVPGKESTIMQRATKPSGKNALRHAGRRSLTLSLKEAVTGWLFDTPVLIGI